MAPQPVLGIILARGGSKRLPRKNITLVNGKSLLSYTCEAALDSRLLTRVLLSTEDEEIAENGRTCGVAVPFLRPRELALDETDSFSVVLHVLSELEKQEQYKPEIICLLQPTSPLRTASHIDEGIELLRKTSANSVIGVVEVPHVFEPNEIMRIRDGFLMPALAESVQHPDKSYAFNGAIYVLKTDYFLAHPENPFTDLCRPLVMDRISSLDIDTDVDLALAEVLLSRRAIC